MHRHRTSLSMPHLCSFTATQPRAVTCIRRRLRSTGVRPRPRHRFHHSFQSRLVDTVQAMQWQRYGTHLLPCNRFCS